MSEPHIIITHLTTLRAIITGGHKDPGQYSFPRRKEDQIYSSEEVELISPFSVSVDGFVSVDSDRWTVHDPDDADALIVHGGTCTRCTKYGRTYRLTRDETTWLIVMENFCPDCTPRSVARGLLPPMHRWVADAELSPDNRLETPIEVQQRRLDEILDFSLVGHSVLYSGPAGAGKSVMASALLKATCSVYIGAGFTEDHPDCALPIWRVNIPEWIDEMMTHRTRDFEASAETFRPEPNTQSVCTFTRYDPDGWRNERSELVYSETCPNHDENYPPVLFLEEVDKFRSSESTRDWLFGLLNTVMEAGGAIISTCNKTPAELEKHLGAPLYRRIVESSKDRGTRIREFQPSTRARSKKV
ncbi:MAG: hypothetical protein ABI072_00815 [Edaphobacter sp.]